MSKNYNFKDQEQLLEIALQICEDTESKLFDALFELTYLTIENHI